MKKLVYILLIWTGVSSCRKDFDLPSYQYRLDTPAHFPEMELPEDNPITPAKIKLGKLLFEDVRLSKNESVSCASCHFSQNAFSDTVAFSVGLYGQNTLRNSPPLFNLGYHPYYFKDGGAPTLEIQVIAPIHNEIEMDMNILEVCDILNTDGDYTRLSQEVFNTEVTPFVVSRSIATYLRTLVSANSRYDRFIEGDESALTSIEKEGLSIFEGKANCVACHSGFDFTNYSFQNNGIHLSYGDLGRRLITGLPEDDAKFKVASLRNLSFTGPYMFDGSLVSLEEVIEHYNSGGMNHTNQSDDVYPLNLTENEKQALLAFLLSLNDDNFVSK